MLKKGTYTTNWVALTNRKIGQNAASFVVFGSFFSTQFGITTSSRLSFIDKGFGYVGRLSCGTLQGVWNLCQDYI